MRMAEGNEGGKENEMGVEEGKKGEKERRMEEVRG